MSTPFKAAYNSANQVLNGPGLSSVVYRKKGGRGYPQQGDFVNFLLGLLENKKKRGKKDFQDSLDAETVEVPGKKRIPQPEGRGFYQQGDFTKEWIKNMFSERKAGGGLSNLRESIDINGQPHKLAYINPDEASLLKAMGGSGRKVNGVPAYFMGDYSDADAGYSDADSVSGSDQAAAGEGYMGTGQDVADTAGAPPSTPASVEFTDIYGEPITASGLGYYVPTAGGHEGLVKSYEDLGTWAAKNAEHGLTHGQWQKKLTDEGFDPWQTAYLNAQIAQGKSVAEAQSALSSALASGKGMALEEAFNTGYSYGGPAGTLQGMFEDIALGYTNQLKDVLKPLTKDRKEGIEGLLDNLKGTGKEEMQEAIGKWADEKGYNFNPYTGDMHNIIGGLVGLLMPGTGLPQMVARGLGQNPIGTITIDGKEYTVTASGDIVAETGPVNTAGPFENRRTRRLPTIMKDVIKKDEEEEEEKKSIADLVGPGDDLVGSLSLENLRNLLQNIYGPNYEPFGEEA